MVLANFKVDNNLGKSLFFQKIFWLANISMEVILDILFLTLNNANMLFAKRDLTWKLYIPAKALLITKQVQIISQKEFTATFLNLDKKVFIVHIAFLGLSLKMSIYPA